MEVVTAETGPKQTRTLMCKQPGGPHKAPDEPLAGGWALAETRSVSVMCVQSQLVSDH